MSLSKLIAVSILCSSSLAFADAASEKATNERKWTLQAAEMYATKGNAEKKPAVTAPGVLVDAQRDPQNKR